MMTDATEIEMRAALTAIIRDGRTWRNHSKDIAKAIEAGPFADLIGQRNALEAENAQLREAADKIHRATMVPLHKIDDLVFIRACCRLGHDFAGAALGLHR